MTAKGPGRISSRRASAGKGPLAQEKEHQGDPKKPVTGSKSKVVEISDPRLQEGETSGATESGPRCYWLPEDQVAYDEFVSKCAKLEEDLIRGIDSTEVEEALLRLRRTLVRIQVIRNAFWNSRTPAVSSHGKGIESVLKISRNSAYQWIHQLGLTPKQFVDGQAPLRFLIEKSKVIQETLSFLKERREKTPRMVNAAEPEAAMVG